jgi:hypothetical protein
MRVIIFSVLLLVLSFSTNDVVGHGMMFDPPQRSSMWRFGYETPVNTMDNFLSCGYVGVNIRNSAPQ